MKLPKIFSVPIVLGHFDFGDKEYFIPKAGLPKYRGEKVLYLIGQRPIFENWSFGIREHCSSRQWLWNTEGRSRTKEDPTNSRNQRIHQLRLLGIMLTVSFKIYLVPEGICSPGNSESLCEWLKGPPGRRAPGDANREGVLPYRQHGLVEHTHKDSSPGQSHGDASVPPWMPNRAGIQWKSSSRLCVLQDLKTNTRPNEHIITAGSAR